MGRLGACVIAFSGLSASMLAGCGGGADKPPQEAQPQPAPGPAPVTPEPTPRPTPAPTPHPDAKKVRALSYVGGQCDALTGESCNPYQFPILRDEAFIPPILLQTSTDELSIDETMRIDEDTSVQIEKTVSSTSVKVSQNFGLPKTTPISVMGLSFTAGYNFQGLAKDMNTYRVSNYFSKAKRKITIYTASISPRTAVKLAPDLADSIEALPENATNETEVRQWFSFFKKYGTHYTKSIAFGGLMQVTNFVSSQVQEDEKFAKHGWTANLGASFAMAFGLDLHWDNENTEEKYQHFQQYIETSKSTKNIVGGREGISNYSDWLHTVRENPAPIETRLGSIGELMPGSKGFDRMLEKYFTVCPSTPDLGVCNAYGACDFEKGLCKCGLDSYLEDDGNCYPLCEKDGHNKICSGNGKCVRGRCTCYVDGDGFGHRTLPGGKPCSTPCGEKLYDFGAGHCIAMHGGHVLANEYDQTCSCRRALNLPQPQSVSGFREQNGGKKCFHTYDCYDSQVCNPGHCVFGSCACMRSLRCRYGTGAACSDSTTGYISMMGAASARFMGRRDPNATNSSANLFLA